MTDIVERLRSPKRDVAAAHLCVEAADEIERLRDAAAVNSTSMEVIRDAAIWLKRNKKEASNG